MTNGIKRLVAIHPLASEQEGPISGSWALLHQTPDRDPSSCILFSKVPLGTFLQNASNERLPLLKSIRVLSRSKQRSVPAFRARMTVREPLLTEHGAEPLAGERWLSMQTASHRNAECNGAFLGNERAANYHRSCCSAKSPVTATSALQ